jgi:hypothetical protein
VNQSSVAPRGAHDLGAQFGQAQALFRRGQGHDREGGGAFGDGLQRGFLHGLALALLQLVGLGQDDLIADGGEVQGVQRLLVHALQAVAAVDQQIDPLQRHPAAQIVAAQVLELATVVLDALAQP